MEVNYSMELAKLEDLEFLLELRMETMDEHLKNEAINLTTSEHKERVLNNFEYARIIFYKKEKIGLLKLLKTETNYEIEQIQIKKKYQGKGLGQKIITGIITEAASESLPILLSVLKQNKASKLYKRLGFKITGEDEDSYLMVKF